MKNPESPSDYRPVALCNVLYKIVTKIITCRLSTLLDPLIDKNQSAFIPGRQILDNIVAAKELVHSMNHSNSVLGSFALKLDMSKAYDRVDWPYLSNVLHSFGINDKAHDLIMNCVTTASFSVLVNGLFCGERGIRQGCPLSPYLFILCSQSLTCLMKKMESEGLYSGYKLNRWAPSVSHLMFADDVLLFGVLNSNTIQAVTNILQQYSRWSGQQVNYNKSAVFFSKSVRKQDKRKLFSCWESRKWK